jgi:MFS family permease
LESAKLTSREFKSPVLLTLSLLLAGIPVAIHQFKVPPIMIEVANSVGLTDDKAPLLMSAFMLACFALSLPAGLLVEKAKVKHAIALAACFSAAGSGVGSYAGSATVLLISRGLEGAGFVLMCIAIPVAVSTYVNPKDLGLVMGICSVWISLGSILAYNTVPLLGNSYSWGGIWKIYAVLTVAGIALFWILFGSDPASGSVKRAEAVDRNSLSGSAKQMEATPGSASVKPLEVTPGAATKISATGEPAAKPSLAAAFGNRNLILPAIGFMAFNINMIAMFTFFPVSVTAVGLMTIEKASFIASLPMILSLGSLPLFGKLADRVGHKSLYMLTLFGGGVGVGLMFVKSVPVILAGAVLLGLVGSATPGLIFSSIGKLIPSQDLIAQSNGIVILFQNAGLFISTALFGVLVTALGGNYTIAGLLLIPMTLFAVGLVSAAKYNE